MSPSPTVDIWKYLRTWKGKRSRGGGVLNLVRVYIDQRNPTRLSMRWHEFFQMSNPSGINLEYR